MFEVRIEQIDPEGKITDSELVRTHTMSSEAVFTAASLKRAMDPEKLDKTHRVTIYITSDTP